MINHARGPLAVLSALLLAGVALSADRSKSAVDRALDHPPATGLLVTRVVEGTQAAAAGILAGDVIVSYGGRPTPDIPAMNLAMSESAKKEEVTLKVVRWSGELTFCLEPGRIGVHLLEVVKGQGRNPLPEATTIAFDFSPLREEPLDDWYAFYREDAKCGVGRITAKLVGDSLFVMSKEIIDFGNRLDDHEVTSVVTGQYTALPLMTVFRDRMNDWVLYGLWRTDHRRESVWSVVSQGPGIEEQTTVKPLDPDAVPAYTIEVLAAFMPREVSACFRFRPLYEGSGETGLGAALLGVGEEEIVVAGKAQKAFRYDWRRLEGGTNGTFWVGANDRVVLADYGQIRAERTTETKAPQDQPESVTARLAR